MRPDNLFEVSRRVAEDGEPFDPTLREFFDTFYLELAAREASLARQPMAWCAGYGMTLRQPHFAGRLESLMALLTLESPAAFRRRLLFVSKNALSRASQHVAEPPVTA